MSTRGAGARAAPRRWEDDEDDFVDEPQRRTTATTNGTRSTTAGRGGGRRPQPTETDSFDEEDRRRPPAAQTRQYQRDSELAGQRRTAPISGRRRDGFDDSEQYDDDLQYQEEEVPRRWPIAGRRVYRDERDLVDDINEDDDELARGRPLPPSRHRGAAATSGGGRRRLNDDDDDELHDTDDLYESEESQGGGRPLRRRPTAAAAAEYETFIVSGQPTADSVDAAMEELRSTSRATRALLEFAIDRSASRSPARGVKQQPQRPVAFQVFPPEGRLATSSKPATRALPPPPPGSVDASPPARSQESTRVVEVVRTTTTSVGGTTTASAASPTSDYIAGQPRWVAPSPGSKPTVAVETEVISTPPGTPTRVAGGGTSAPPPATVSASPVATERAAVTTTTSVVTSHQRQSTPPPPPEQTVVGAASPASASPSAPRLVAPSTWVQVRGPQGQDDQMLHVRVPVLECVATWRMKRTEDGRVFWKNESTGQKVWTLPPAPES